MTTPPPPRSEDETELKISVSAKDMEKVFKTLSKKSSASKVYHRFRPRKYYDTDELGLYENNISLRVQYKDGKEGRIGHYEQTVKIEKLKATAMGKGVLQRKECKNALTDELPDMEKVTDADANDALKPFAGKPLKHIFTAAAERRYFTFHLQSGKKQGVVEVAFDKGHIILADKSKQIDLSEIEIELKKGGKDFMKIMRDKILDIAPNAKIQKLSKGDQGCQLHLKHKGPKT